MTTFKLTDKIGDIVLEFAGAAELFKEHKIDFCCGGQRPLYEVAKDEGVDEEDLLSELNERYQQNQDKLEKMDFKNNSSAEIIDYIVNTHHAYLNRVLPELSELTTKILRVHGPGHDYLEQLHKQFHILKMDLEQHLIKEEIDLFPLIKKYEANPDAQTLSSIFTLINKLDEEHNDAGDILKLMRDITEDYQLPADACKTFARTYQLLEELESDMFQHIHIENNILFPRLHQGHDIS